jgi:HAD superfamily phosphoserine phosphatase-like hydrolase
MTQQPQYAFFDFDGTLIAKDSFRILLRHQLIQRPWCLFFWILFTPVFIYTFSLKREKTLSKSLLLWSITFGMTKKEILRLFSETLPQLLTPYCYVESKDTVEGLKKQGVEIVVASASAAIWIRPFIKKHYGPIRLTIGSPLRFFAKGVILSQHNCYGKRKTERIYSLLHNPFLWHSSWSDHIADVPLLKEAPRPFLVSPSSKHLMILTKIFHKNSFFKVFYWKTKS